MTAPAYGNLTTDLAEHLANLGFGQWNPNGIYKSFAPPAIYLGIIPDEAGPSIALNIYHHSTTNGRDTGTPEIRVQIRIKGSRDPRLAQWVGNDIYTALHEQTDYELDNGTRVLLSQRVLTHEERDPNLVWHRVDSYAFTVNPS
ncbi:hypothetical protein H0194_04565 [Corynebacterium incognita]|uniref:DUF3168 domain-containing protein n=1 Tax=Corynebacterium incognita TaxID=2754725 RepID=A0A7G7CRP0_9CORY|nr:minor capsid protein [Corynebacterium incognita]QNE90256.1 hypothetical protein H0194_04565 [Corynebacterium incognita]